MQGEGQTTPCSYRLQNKLAIFAGVILIVGLIILSNALKATPNIKTSPPLVSVTMVTKKSMPFSLEDVGTVVPDETVAVNSRIDSQIVSVNFEDGNYVEKGDLLFTLDDSTINSQINQIQANLEHDQALLSDMLLQYNRKKDLVSKQADTQTSLDDAKANYEAQLATVKATKASIDSLHIQLEYTRILAPISGRAGTINITAGNNVRANDPQSLVVINQVKPIKIQISLPQRHFVSLRETMSQGTVSIKISQDTIDEVFDGTVEYIDNSINQPTGTFIIRAITPNENEKLWPGMFVKAKIILDQSQNVLSIPEVAIQHGQDGDFVYVAQDGKAVKHKVSIGRYQDGYAVISTGLNEGQQVIIDGIMFLKDGSDIVIQKENQNPNPTLQS